MTVSSPLGTDDWRALGAFDPPAPGVAQPQPSAPPPVTEASGAASGAGASLAASFAGGDVLPRALIHPQQFEDASGDAEWWIASDLDDTPMTVRLISALQDMRVQLMGDDLVEHVEQIAMGLVNGVERLADATTVEVEA